MEHKKALIGMSGGVDSSVAAYLTQKQGLDCIGASMLLCASEATNDAAKAAAALGMDFCVLDMQDAFRRQVQTHFVQSYEDGLTPNPCIVCNRHLKFGAMLEAALSLGCDCVVTGHYARIRIDPETGRYLLCKAADTQKDQSYFLYSLTQQQLSRTRFPLGGMTKQQVRAIALQQDLVTAHKQDSQDICFVPDGDYRTFLEHFTGKHYPSGDFLDLQGNIVGQHSGAVGYTLGQRKGLGLAMGEPVYVCDKDMEKNTITVGPNEALYRQKCLVRELNWIAFETLSSPMEVLAKARSRMTEQPATVSPQPDGTVTVEFREPQRALTPGQAVVFYRDDVVLGGGTLAKTL